MRCVLSCQIILVLMICYEKWAKKVTEIRESMVTMTKSKKPTAKQIMVGSSILAVILSTMIVVGELSNR